MEGWLDRVLLAWVGGVRRRAVLVVVLAAVASAASLAIALTQLGVNTRHTAIIDERLPFWRDYEAFAEYFPILDEALLVVVDAETPGGAREAALELADALAAQPERYSDVYVPGGDPFFERNALLYLSVDELYELSDQLAGVQPLLAEVSKDSSLIHLARTLREGIERQRTNPNLPLDLSLAFDSISRAVRAVLAGAPKPISWTELILRRKLPGDEARRVVVVWPVLDYSRLVPGREAIAGVREAARGLGLVPENGVTVRITGNVALNTEEMVIVGRGTVLAAIASIVLVAIILSLALRSWHLVGSALLTLLASLLITAAFAALAVGHVNLVSVAFAVLIIGLGIDFGIHFCMRYAELLRADSSHEEALDETVRSVGGSLVLCAVTTAMAFYVFIPTDFKAVGELGLIAGSGMLVSLFCSLSVLPALLTVWPEQRPGSVWGGALWFERVVITASADHPRAVRWGAAGLALAAVPALLLVRFDPNVARMRDPSTESVQTFEELLEESDTTPWTMDVMMPSLDAATELAARLRELPVVDRAVTLRDYVPERQQEKLAILQDLGYFVPEPRDGEPAPKAPIAEQIAALEALRAALAAPSLAGGDPARAASAAQAERQLGRFLRRLEALDRKARQQAELASFERALTGSLPDQMQRLWRATQPDGIALETLPASLVQRMVAPDGTARIEVLPVSDLTDNTEHARFVDEVRQVVPGVSGGAVTILEFGRAVWRSFVQALVSAVIAVAVLLALLWRRLSDMLLVVVPLGLAALLTTAAAGVAGVSFNFANVIVLPLLLGIGVDSGIHLVHRHRVTIETTGHAAPPERGLLETSTAQAVFFSALTTMASFGTLAFSSHLGFASLGRLLLLGIVFTLVANLVLLPALIEWRGAADDRSDDEEAA